MDITHGKPDPSGNQEGKREDFFRFLDAYPKPPSPPQVRFVRIQWDLISPSADEVDAMLDQIAKETRSDNWQKNNGQYIPSAENWLRKWRESPHEIKPKQPDQWDEFAYYAFLRTAKAMGMDGDDAEEYAKWACGVMDRIPSYQRRGSS